MIDAPVPIVVVTVIAPPVSVVGVNPVPTTVTEIPLGSWSGASVIAGLVTVNVAVARSKLLSAPVAVTG